MIVDAETNGSLRETVYSIISPTGDVINLPLLNTCSPLPDRRNLCENERRTYQNSFLQLVRRVQMQHGSNCQQRLMAMEI